MPAYFIYSFSVFAQMEILQALIDSRAIMSEEKGKTNARFDY
jgi:hypothetical protein